MQQTDHIASPPTAGPRPFATHWERYDRMMEPFELQLIDAASLPPGAQVIDVGCRAGTTSLNAGRSVGASGTVVGIDLSPEMLRTAGQRARATGLTQVRFTLADAATMTLEPGWADAIVSRFGTMHFDEPARGYQNLLGGLRVGGHIHFVCTRAAQYNPWATVPIAALLQVSGRSFTLPTNGPFTLADPNRILTILDAAGFERVAIRSIDRDLYLGADVDDALEFFFETQSHKISPLLEAIGYPRATETLRQALRPYAGAHGVWMPGSAWLVSATRGNVASKAPITTN